MNYSSCDISPRLVPGNFLLHNRFCLEKEESSWFIFFFNPEFHKSNSYSGSKIAIHCYKKDKRRKPTNLNPPLEAWEIANEAV